MQDTQNDKSLSEIEQDLSQLKATLYSRIGEFLWRDAGTISEEFLYRFNQIREDVLSKLPWELSKYFLAKEQFSRQYVAQCEAQTIKKGKKKKSIGPFPIYIDPRLRVLSVESRKKLLEFSDFLVLEPEWKKYPDDVLIRAVNMIKIRSIAVLEWRENFWSVVSLTQAEKLMRKDQSALTKAMNFKVRWWKN